MAVCLSPKKHFYYGASNQTNHGGIQYHMKIPPTERLTDLDSRQTIQDEDTRVCRPLSHRALDSCNIRIDD